jgi:threonyl-tRNA synthetase
MDLCRGPHLPSTGRLGAFAASIAGAYWRGDENAAVATHLRDGVLRQGQLAAFVHRRGKRRSATTSSARNSISSPCFRAPGFPFWLPNGTIVFNELVDEMRRKLRRRDYVEVRLRTS